MREEPVLRTLKDLRTTPTNRLIRLRSFQIMERGRQVPKLTRDGETPHRRLLDNSSHLLDPKVRPCPDFKESESVTCKSPYRSDVEG